MNGHVSAVRGVWDRPRRIHVIGGEASGKTTLARRIGRELGVEVFNLDYVAWRAAGNPRRSSRDLFAPDFQPADTLIRQPIERRRVEAWEIARREEWVSEGVYLDWVDPLFARAELIVWLDSVAWWKSAARIVRRYARTAADEVRTEPGPRKLFRFGPVDIVRNLRTMLSILARVYRYHHPGLRAQGDPDEGVTRRATELALGRYGAKVVRIRSAGDVEALIRRLRDEET